MNLITYLLGIPIGTRFEAIDPMWRAGMVVMTAVGIAAIIVGKEKNFGAPNGGLVAYRKRGAKPPKLRAVGV